MTNKVYMLALVALLGIGGCSSDGDERRQKYLDADYYTRLELPPDLTAPEDSKQLVSPQPTPDALEKFKSESAKVGVAANTEEAGVPVSIKVEGARLVMVCSGWKSMKIRTNYGRS